MFFQCFSCYVFLVRLLYIGHKCLSFSFPANTSQNLRLYRFGMNTDSLMTWYEDFQFFLIFLLMCLYSQHFFQISIFCHCSIGISMQNTPRYTFFQVAVKDRVFLPCGQGSNSAMQADRLKTFEHYVMIRRYYPVMPAHCRYVAT